MDLYSAINGRRTIRDLQDKEIPMDVLHRIINAGLKAPTNDHLRNWEFIIITEKEEKARIINKIPKTYTKEAIKDFIENYNMTDDYQIDMYMEGVPKQYSMLYHSGCIILPFFKQDSPLLRPDSLNALNGFASIWCCIENIFLAATAEGLGAAFRIPFPDEIPFIKEITGHPDNYLMPCYIALGYPSEHTVKNLQHEYDAPSKIHINRW